MIPIGTLFNVAMVLFGGAIGLFFNRRLGSELNKKIFFLMGLFTIVLGCSMAIKTTSFIFMLISIIVGTIWGEYANLDFQINQLIDKLKNKLKIKDEQFTDGLVTSFLLFCVGSMTIVGSINEGLGQEPVLLYTKSCMDGISSIILASSFGLGVLFSVFPMLLFQGGITICVFYYKDFLTPELIEHISAVGGVLIIAMGFKILGYKKLNPTNMLPSLIVAVLLYELINI